MLASMLEVPNDQLGNIKKESISNDNAIAMKK